MEPAYFDTHSHLQLSSYDKDRTEVLERMKKESVFSLVVGTDAESSGEAVEATTLWPEGLWAVVGVHPTDTKVSEIDTAHFRALLQRDKVVAVGECGLDYYRLEGESSEEKKRQKKIFVTQIELALEHNLPLMLHTRPSNGTMDAYADVIEILRSYAREAGEKLRGNAHFFVGDVAVAKEFLELGFTLSFSGVITFAREYDEVVRYIPKDMILSETDSPFAAPLPYRGKRNEPVYVAEVVKKIAEIRGEDFEKVRVQLVENARKAFDIRGQAPLAS